MWAASPISGNQDLGGTNVLLLSSGPKTIILVLFGVFVIVMRICIFLERGCYRGPQCVSRGRGCSLSHSRCRPPEEDRSLVGREGNIQIRGHSVLSRVSGDKIVVFC